MCGENFSVYGVHIPRESMHFYSCSRQNFLKICFPHDERGEENYDLLYQNSVRKYEDDLEH